MERSFIFYGQHTLRVLQLDDSTNKGFVNLSCVLKKQPGKVSHRAFVIMITHFSWQNEYIFLMQIFM